MNGVVIAIGIAALIGFLVWFFEFRQTDGDKQQERRLAELREEGIQAVAHVKEVHDISGTKSSYNYMDWALEVTLPTGESYDVSTNELYARRDFLIDTAFVAYAQKKGAIIPVTVHPTEHQIIEIDRDRLRKLVQEQ